LIPLQTLPSRLFFSALPDGRNEFSCFIRMPAERLSETAARIAWSIRETTVGGARLESSRPISAEEAAAGRAFLAAIPPSEWGDSLLEVEVLTGRPLVSARERSPAFGRNRRFDCP
jgi:hypothetical protein